MALRILFEGTVAKHVESPDDNEDAYRTSSEGGRVVVSDGASESFDAHSWSRLLVERMIETDLSLDAVAECAQGYEALHDPSSLSWSKAAAYERGSFATLLIAQDMPERNAVKVTAVGDSLAIWSDGSDLLSSTPYKHAQQFQENPTLLATRLGLNALAEVEGHGVSVEWAYEERGYRLLLCMTDALGAWLLHHQEQGDPSALEQLIRIREPHDLLELVEAERATGKLRRDDTTLIIASFTHSS